MKACGGGYEGTGLWEDLHPRGDRRIKLNPQQIREK